MKDNSSFRKKIVYEQVIPGREAVYAPFPERLSPEICRFLTEREKISSLYVHQAEMFDRVTEGENTVITTSTASGKTLAFLLPVLQTVLDDPQTRAIFIYPTKALASDQFRNLLPALDYFGNHRIQAGIYDGDTPVSERSRIRSSANIILTNPEMLNAAFLPHHSHYGFNFIFSNLKYIVIDELHSYRGAFGSHLANVFRRLTRICNYYHSSPRFLCSSATIANPVDLAETICGRPFSLISKDGSPAPEKTYYLWQPPRVRDTEFRISPAREAVKLLPLLVTNHSHFIAFCKSHNAVEIVLKESRDRLKDNGTGGPDLSLLIAGYRGGYKPLERKETEKKMTGGQLTGLVATNALELGIDIGQLDTAVLVGFPGTKASFWQQSGRAGRKGNAATIFLLLDNLPMDQYLAIDPEWLFNGKSEHAVVDKNNLFIQLAHIRAAAAELPLSPDDIAFFPDLGEVVPVLLNAREVNKDNGRFMWTGKAFPAGDFSLRNIDKSRYKLKNRTDGSLLTEMDELQAFREIYKGAIYMHEGLQYLVEKLDTEHTIAEAVPIDVNYYTISCDTTEVTKIKEHKSRALGRTQLCFGDVKVAYTTFGLRRLQFHNHQNLGYEKLDYPLSKTFETESFWIRLPSDVFRLFSELSPQTDLTTGLQYWKTYFEGLSFVLLNSAMMVTMTTADDIGGALLAEAGTTEPVFSVCIFDLYAGGLGFSNKACEHAEDIIANAIKMVKGCSCKDGCSACVGDYHLDKQVVLWGLESLFATLEPPQSFKSFAEAVEVPEEKPFKWSSLPEQWSAFVDFAGTNNEYLSRFLKVVPSARTEDNKLYLKLPSSFFKKWLSDEMNLKNLANLVRQYCAVPPGFEIGFEYDDRDKGRTDDPKLLKMYKDLIR